MKDKKEKLRKLSHLPLYQLTITEPRIYNGERTVSSINTTGKTGQPNAKE